MVRAACHTQWVVYTAGGDLPALAVVGGRMATGDLLYVMRVMRSSVWCGGYYSAADGVGYQCSGGCQSFTNMKILVEE